MSEHELGHVEVGPVSRHYTVNIVHKSLLDVSTAIDFDVSDDELIDELGHDQLDPDLD